MQDLVENLSLTLKSKGLKLACAESCTGGLLAAIMTGRPGSSAIFERGFVTYSNESKQELLGVSDTILREFGAVSSECARAMAEGALKNSRADIALSITGVAGPDGGSAEKPVGLVYFGYAVKNGPAGTLEQRFAGDRNAVREQAAATAITCLLSVLEESA